MFLLVAVFSATGVWRGAEGQNVNSMLLLLNSHLNASMAQMDGQGSVYLPLDNWVYSALDRLHALGYVDTAFLACGPGPGYQHL
ncbi:MAG: hypothetical protein ABSB50_17230 [Terracidiphilus sp.]